MKNEYRHLRETIPYMIDARHKVTPYTEKNNFHLHDQMEIIYALSDNQIFYSENSVFRVPAHSLLLINSMALHYLSYLDNGEDCDRYVLTFTPDIILRLNTPEINLLDCFLLKANDGLLLNVPEDLREDMLYTFETLCRESALFKQESLREEETGDGIGTLLSKTETGDGIGTLLSKTETGDGTGTLLSKTETGDGIDPVLSDPESAAAADSTDSRHLLRDMDLLGMTMLLGNLLVKINRHIYLQYDRPLTPAFKEHSQLVTQVCHYIDQHFEEPLCVNDIAHRFSVSRTQLYNHFREILHMSVNEYLLNVRMSQAKALLINSDYSVEIISQKTGYNSISSFSRAFKSFVKNSPMQYRKLRRA